MAAPTFVSATPHDNPAGYPITETWSYTCAGDLLLVIITTVGSVAWDFTSVTFNGDALTLAGRHNGSSQGTMWIYYRLSPDQTTGNIVCTKDDQNGDICVMTPVDIDGVHATVPIGATNFQSDGTSETVTLTTTGTDSMVIFFGSPYYHTDFTWGGDSSTLAWSDTTNANMYQKGQYATYASSGSTASKSLTVAFNSVFGGAVEIMAAAAGGGTNPKGPLGNPFFGPFGGAI